MYKSGFVTAAVFSPFLVIVIFVSIIFVAVLFSLFRVYQNPNILKQLKHESGEAERCGVCCLSRIMMK